MIRKSAEQFIKTVLIAGTVLSLTACAIPVPAAQAPAAEAEAPAEEAATSEEAAAAEESVPVTAEYTVFTGNDGWSVRYDPALIEAAAVDEHAAQFVYTGEAAGTSMVSIQFIENKQPEEALAEVTSEWTDDPASLLRIEGFFPGADDKWGYWRILNPETDEDGSIIGSGLAETAIAGEYNGGVLLFEVTAHMSGDDAVDVPMNDTLSDLIGSVTYEDFGPQEMYSYIPGTYAATAEGDTRSLILKEDHTGTLRLEEDAPVLWGSTQIMADDGSFRYQYTIEGEALYLQIAENEDWIEFRKEAAEE